MAKTDVTNFQTTATTALVRISADLLKLREMFLELGEGPWEPPLERTERKIVNRFLLSCALFESDPEIRRVSWGTVKPSEFLAGIEWVVQKLERCRRKR